MIWFSLNLLFFTSPSWRHARAEPPLFNGPIFGKGYNFISGRHSVHYLSAPFWEKHPFGCLVPISLFGKVLYGHRCAFDNKSFGNGKDMC